MLQALKDLRKAKGQTLKEVGEAIGVAESTMSQYERGNRQPDFVTLLKLARYFGTSTDYLLTGALPHAATPAFGNMVPVETKKIPLLGEITCGQLRYAEEEMQGYVEIGADIGADFALRCQGDSMTGARILDGDIVFIRQQPTVENGEIAAVIEGDEATLKRFRRFGNLVILSPENPSYNDIIINLDAGETFHIIGKAVAFQSKVR